MSAKIFGALGGVAACSAAIALLIGGNGLAQVVKASINPDQDPDPGHTETETGVHFYNDDVNVDDNPNNDCDFGPAAYEDVMSGKYTKLFDELLDRMDYKGSDDPKGCDPNLMAAVAYTIDLSKGTDILKESHDSSLKLGERPNKAAERLLNDAKARQEVYDKLKAQFTEAEVTVEDLKAYTSQMYQIPTGKYFDDRPAITVKDTRHEGGHVLVFRWEDGTEVKLRLECGYQPTDVPEWNPPSDDVTPPPTTTKLTETTSTTPTETTTLQSKNASEAPPVQGDPDIGGTVRVSDVNTTPTPESDINDLPSSYVAPDRPTGTQTTTAATEETVHTGKVVTGTSAPATQAPTESPQVTHEGKTYTQAPPQQTNPPLEDYNDNAPTVSGNGTGVQTGTIPDGALDRFG